MWSNYYEAEQIRKEHVKDALHKEERVRLIWAARGPRKSRDWRWLVRWIRECRWAVLWVLKGLLSVLTGRQEDLATN